MSQEANYIYEVPRHMVTIIHASQEDIVAKHDLPQRGSIFISSLCTVLNKYPAEELDLSVYART